MKKLSGNKLIIAVAVILVLLLVSYFGFRAYISSIDKPFDAEKKDTVSIIIEPGSTTEDIGLNLEANKVIESAKAFKLFSRVKGYDADYQAGAYAIAPSMSLSEIAEIIVSGKTNTKTFTVPEGYTIYQMADKLSADGLVDKDKFTDLLVNGDFDYDFLKGAQGGKNHLEGYLFPETYTVEYDADERDIIETMLGQFDLVFDKEMRKQADKLGISINEAVVIASIIERECVIDDERAKVASVIYNRLDKPMPLQMCSTVQYVLGKQKETLTDADTRISSPYNTYLNDGIPPGPICCPGIASIRAALYPEDTDYLYFVVSEKLDGSQNFSSNYSDFLKDKEAYYKALEGNN